ncbi:MAG: hypothetical protein MK080_09430 [Opitutales bacterium]|nr:hypothetical protein [Opitutales bacterium]NRA27954.1 hypothetical protein [Opitutales bacterium]
MPEWPHQWTLVVDASQPEVFVGLMEGTLWRSMVSSTEPALNTIFTLSDQLLSEAALSVEKLDACIHCRGPGSTLGIRLGAMALRTWISQYPDMKVYSYTSLELMRAALRETHALPFSVITDWKKGQWHRLDHDGDAIRTATTDVLQDTEKIFYLPQRKNWQPLPTPHEKIEYQPESLTKHLSSVLEKSADPTVFQHSEPSFPKWIPKRHR